MGKVAMPRKKRKRKVSRTRKVFYIAMEGSVTERRYFDSLIKKYNLRNVYLLKKPKTRSSPTDVIKRLEKQMRNRRDDHGVSLVEKYWAVFDTDLRPIETLERVAAIAARKQIHLATSNPCFELWLLLHFGALRQMRGVEGSAATGGCDKVIEYLKRKFDQNYDKSTFNSPAYMQKINEAIYNASESDSDDVDAWMNSICTRVYKLVQSIIDSST